MQVGVVISSLRPSSMKPGKPVDELRQPERPKLPIVCRSEPRVGGGGEGMLEDTLEDVLMPEGVLVLEDVLDSDVDTSSEVDELSVEVVEVVVVDEVSSELVVVEEDVTDGAGRLGLKLTNNAESPKASPTSQTAKM